MHTKQLSVLHLTGDATVLEYKHNYILYLRIITISVKERVGCKSDFAGFWLRPVLHNVVLEDTVMRDYKWRLNMEVIEKDYFTVMSVSIFSFF